MLSFRKVRNEKFIRLSQGKDILNIVCVHSIYKCMYLPNMNLFNCNSCLTFIASLGDKVMREWSNDNKRSEFTVKSFQREFIKMGLLSCTEFIT